MKFIILSLFFFSFSAQAKDSFGLLCDNGSLALNVFEHRQITPTSSRATTLFLIYGEHLLKGQLVDVDAGPVALSGSQVDAVKEFNGTININYQTNTVTLFGKLNLYGEESTIRTRMKCKGME